MFSRTAAKLSLALRYIVLARKTWRWPRRSDVLVYDAAGQGILVDYLQPWKPELLHCRGEQIDMPVFLSSLFRKGRRRDAYIDEYIERVRPRLVVTCIDNDPAFYRIATRHPDLKTMFVQNGYRGYYLDVFEHLLNHPAPLASYRVDYMLTFGSHTGAEYAKYVAGSVVPVGSLVNNHIPRVGPRKTGVIAFISQYSKQGVSIGNHRFSQEEFCRAPDHAILNFLRQYASDNGKTLRIVTRSRSTEELRDEQAYFRDLAGPAVYFASEDRFGASYEAVDSAEVVVCNTSTLGLEAAARGRKTAFFAIHKDIYQRRDRNLVWDRGLVWPERYPDEGPFWTYRNDPVAFKRILDHLFAIDQEQWRLELERQRYSDIIAYDPENSTFRSILQKELGS